MACRPRCRPLTDLPLLIGGAQDGAANSSNRLVLRVLLSLILVTGAHTSETEEPYGRHQFDDDIRQHWSFQPIKRPDVPACGNSGWVKNPIDAFVLESLAKSGLCANPPADPLTLLRRVYLDLVGLPPTPMQQTEFLGDPSEQAYASVVDGLFAHPATVSVGRHWMDVVRYAETNGYERDGAKPNVWRYRDYVINALNSDKPYDRFLSEQLAGDELDDTDAVSQIATTFLRLGPWDDEPADPLADRYEQLDDVAGTAAATFMSLTLRCARCHDHKFEPFSQRDYTRWLAIFEPLKRPQHDRNELDREVGKPKELAVYREATQQIDAQLAALELQHSEIEVTVCRRAQSGDLNASADSLKDLPAEALSAAGTPVAERSAGTEGAAEETPRKARRVCSVAGHRGRAKPIE